MPGQARWTSLARFVVGIILFGLVLWWVVPSWQSLREQVAIDLLWCGLAALSTSGASLATAWRWRLLAESMGGTRLPFGAYLHALVLTRLIGQFTWTLAMDLVGRGAALRAAGSERGLTHAMTLVVIERFLDIFLPLLAISWAVAVFARGAPPIESAILVTVVFVIVALPAHRPVVALALRFHAAVARRLPARTAIDVPQPVEITSGLAVQVVISSLLRYASVMAQFYCIARAVGCDVSVFVMAAATAFAQLAGFVGFTPGGLGFQEVGWAGSLNWLGADPNAVALFLIAQRPAVIASFALLTILTRPLHRRAPPS